MKRIIHTTKAPAPIGPYSQAVLAGGLLFISGQVAINPASNELVMGDIRTEARQVMENLKAILEAAGSGFDRVVKTTIFLANMDEFGAVNEIYGSYFEGEFPARETVAVKTLPKQVNVEISFVVDATEA